MATVLVARSSALRDFLELELVEHCFGVGVPVGERARELVLLLGLQLRRERRHVAIDDGVDHEGAIAREGALPCGCDLLRPLDADAVEPEQPSIVGVAEIRIVWVAA